MKTKTINSTDKLTLYVKKIKAQSVIEHYQTFGWQLVNEEENSRYEDIVDLSFERAHNISNKDELQLLQIYMENDLNSLAKLENNKHPKTTAFGLFFGVIGLALVVFAALHGFKILNDLSLWICITMASIGCVMLLLTAIFIPKLYKKETLIFEEKSKQYQNNLKNICEIAKKYLGGESHE